MKKAIATIAFAATAALTALPALASTFALSNSGSTFTITRSGEGTDSVEIVSYRTVSQSAFAGRHFAETSGVLVFAKGETSKTVEVEEIPAAEVEVFWRSQAGTSRFYRFELLDEGGLGLASADRVLDYGAESQVSGNMLNRSVTDLVFFNDSNYESGLDGSKYVDVAYTPPSGDVQSSGTYSGYVAIGANNNYSQKPATVATSNLFSQAGSPAYFDAAGCKIYATVCFETKTALTSGDQYIQIVAGDASAPYDGADPDKGVNDPTNSLYKACFDLGGTLLGGSVGKQFYPHRYDYTNRTHGAQSASHTEFYSDKGLLLQHKFNGDLPSCRAAESGSVVLPLSTSAVTARFACGMKTGSINSQFGYKDLFVRMALVDDVAPTLYGGNTDAITVSPGPYYNGDTFYVSVPFSEIVVTTGETKKLVTSWGPMEYDSGDGSNVITFRGTVSVLAGTVLSISRCDCGFADLAGNPYVSGSASFRKSFPSTRAKNWSDWERLQTLIDAATNGAMVVLDRDCVATHGDSTLTVANTVTLDLAGHTINAARQNFSVITINSTGNLTLTNSVPVSGAITGGYSSFGGGVCVNDGGIFTITGGEISGNTASYRGGGVYVNRGTFAMTGGVISGNTSVADGGGAYVNDGKFTMSGGEITGNTAGYCGVYVNRSFSVSGNPVVAGNTNSVGEAKNVYLPSGRTIVVGNLTAGASIGVTAHSTTTSVTITSGAAAGDSQYFFADDPNLLAVEANGEVNLKLKWAVLQDLLDAGGVVTLTDDFTATELESTLIVTNAVTLDLAGHTIDAKGRFGAIEIRSGGDLTLTNSVPESGAITGGRSDYGGGVYVQNGTFTMNGGAISNNYATSKGGGVYLPSSSAFTMTGGEISGNTANDGGGVYVYNGDTFTVSGSPVIVGNTNVIDNAVMECNVYLYSGTIAVSNLTAGARIGVTTKIKPTATSSVAFATGAVAGDETYFFGDNRRYHVERDGSGLQLVKGTTYPTYLEGANNFLKDRYDVWARLYGEDVDSVYEAAFLLDVAPWATPIELRIAGIEMAEGGARVRVTCRAGASAEAGAVDLSQINGVISVSAGDAPDALAPKAASGITYSEGEATIFVPASAGRFVKAVIGLSAPAEGE